MERPAGEAAPRPTTPARVRRARIGPEATMRGWASGLEPMTTETRWSRTWSHLGILISITALVIYLTWRIVFTLPPGGWNLVAAWLLIAFEAVPAGRAWSSGRSPCGTSTPRAPAPVTEASPGHRAAVFIPTYNEPVEVIAPTIAAACALEPAHQTWVLDDGDRPWVAEICDALRRPLRAPRRARPRQGRQHEPRAGADGARDRRRAPSRSTSSPCSTATTCRCRRFLTATLGWFDDPEIALVQAPQTYYNAGAFDDDGDTGEQGMFFHVLLPARNHDGAGPFWCGSTSLIRSRPCREVGGVSTATIVEDMHTTLGLHPRRLEDGVPPPDAGPRSGPGHARAVPAAAPPLGHGLDAGARQASGCGRAKRWLSWRNYYEYLSGTLWWLEGVAHRLRLPHPGAPSWSAAPRSPPRPPALLRGGLRRHVHHPPLGLASGSTASTCTGRPRSRSGSSGSPSGSPACGG